MTALTVSKPLARTKGLVVRELADEVLVYDLERNQAHCLNRPAAVVWKHCDGTRTVGDLSRLIGGALGTPDDERLVWAALEQLADDHLLAARVDGPADRPSLSRRDLARRLGLAAAIAIPVVASIAAPKAADLLSP